MELNVFTEMLGDESALDYNKLKYKFGDENLAGYLETLNKSFYQKLPLLDFKGKPAVWLPVKINLTTQLAKAFAISYSHEKFGIQAMEEEIISTLAIEQIDSSRESVRNILRGGAPQSRDEYKQHHDGSRVSFTERMYLPQRRKHSGSLRGKIFAGSDYTILSYLLLSMLNPSPS